MKNYYVIITIVLIGIMLAVISWRQKQQKIDSSINKDSSINIGAKPILQKEQNDQRMRKIAMITAGSLILAGLISYFILNTKGGSSGSGDDSNSWIAMLPIWIAIWIPLMNKKKKEEPSAKQKKVLLLVVGLTLLAVLGTMAFWLFNS